MKLSTLGIVFQFLAALPTFSNTLPLETRATDGVWICSDKDWKEPCGWVPAWESETLCRGFPYPNSPWLSFGPDSGVTCTIFTDEHCNTADDGSYSQDLTFPGVYEMPGPAYQSGQGTAHFSGYQAYKCHPMSNKRGIDGNEAGNDKDKSTLISIKEIRASTRNVTNRDAGGLSLHATSKALGS